MLHTGDILAYIYTLTAEGTTHGFERGYGAFIGDPFGVEVVTNNLNVTVMLADVPEPGTCVLMLLGIAGLFVYRRRTKLPSEVLSSCTPMRNVLEQIRPRSRRSRMTILLK